MKSVSSIKASSSALIFQIAGLILSKMTVESCTFDCGFGTAACANVGSLCSELEKDSAL